MTREDFQNILENLEKIPSMEIHECGKGKSGLSLNTAIALANGISELTGLKLPDNFPEFIRLGDGFFVSWKFQESIYGEFRLVAPQNVLLRADTTPLWNETMTEMEIDLYKSFQVIDIHCFTGDGQYAALQFDARNFPERIWFVNVDAKFEMNLNYEGYLNKLLETRGLHGWQYFFLKDYDQLKSDDYDLNRAKPLMDNTLKGLEVLFPEVDRSLYLEVYNRVFN